MIKIGVSSNPENNPVFENDEYWLERVETKSVGVRYLMSHKSFVGVSSGYNVQFICEVSAQFWPPSAWDILLQAREYEKSLIE